MLKLWSFNGNQISISRWWSYSRTKNFPSFFLFLYLDRQSKINKLLMNTSKWMVLSFFFYLYIFMRVRYKSSITLREEFITCLWLEMLRKFFRLLKCLFDSWVQFSLNSLVELGLEIGHESMIGSSRWRKIMMNESVWLIDCLRSQVNACTSIR